MPRADRPDAADAESAVVADGVVPGLPPRARAVYPAARAGLQHGLAAAGWRSADAGAQAGAGVPDLERQPADQLLDLPPLIVLTQPAFIACGRAVLFMYGGSISARSAE